MSEEQQRRVNRALTQKYNMHELRALQKLEEKLRTQTLVAAFGVEEEDELPSDVSDRVDLMRIFNGEVEQWENSLREMLSGVPGDVDSIVNELLAGFNNIKSDNTSK